MQYSFPGSKGDPHLTATVPRTVNPFFDDARTWEFKEDSEVMELRSQELEVMVLDDDDDGDDEAGLIGTGKLSIGSFVDKQQGGEVQQRLCLYPIPFKEQSRAVAYFVSWSDSPCLFIEIACFRASSLSLSLSLSHTHTLSLSHTDSLTLMLLV